MVYLAGYGLQLAGENYFVPVDSAINRDTDVPIEALRIGDYIRQLASLPLKAGIVVLDAARQQPFVNGQIASGLALVEADPHMLIAFNAAPGTVAPAEQGPYGVYAQSLAEMIRTGGLPLPEVFNRVRLRVNEASKGAQVPWDSQKVDAAFTFFERAPDAPRRAAAGSGRRHPQTSRSAISACRMPMPRRSSATRCRPTRIFSPPIPTIRMAKRVRAIVAARREAITWRRTYRADTPNAYWSYLRRYPRGPHAADARRRLAILTAPLEPPPTFDVIDYDVPPPPPDEIDLCRPAGAGLRRSRVRFRAAATAAGLLPAAAAGGFRRVGAAAAADRAVHPAAADLRADTGLCAGAASMWRRRRTTSSSPTSTTGPSSTTSSTGRRSRGPGAVPGRAGAKASGRPGRPPGGCAGAGWRHADAAACRRATGHADPAGQAAGAAERRDQSCGEDRLAGRSGRPDRNAERDRSRRMRRTRCLRTSPCRGPNALPVPGARGAPPAPPSAAVSPPGAVNPNARLAPGATPPASALRPRPGGTGSRPAVGATAPAAPADRRDRAFRPAPHSGRLAGRCRTGRCAATQRRRAAEAGRGDCAETSAAARNSACAATVRGARGKAAAGRPRRSTAATAEDGGASAADGRRAATSDGRAVATRHRRMAAPPPPRRRATTAAPDGCASAAPGSAAAAAAKRCPPNVPKC